MARFFEVLESFLRDDAEYCPEAPLLRVAADVSRYRQMRGLLETARCRGLLDVFPFWRRLGVDTDILITLRHARLRAVLSYTYSRKSGTISLHKYRRPPWSFRPPWGPKLFVFTGR